MSDTDLNGSTPVPAPPDGEPCLDCATSGEKALAVLAGLLGAFIIVMALDMFTGGRISGYVRDKTPAPQ